MSTPSLSHPASGEQPHHQRVPGIFLKAVLAMVLLSLAIAVFARVSGMEPAATPNDEVGIVQERLLRINGTLGGSATILDPDGNVIVSLGPKEAGFITGVQSALDRIRMLHKVEGNPPVRIVRFADGRLALRDPATGWRVELISFGDTNREAFEALLN